ncbi:MAG: hypothetical protein HKP61_15235 [Dactylosporangium sp.]|nr:hypothetical protein [Dactylosporangium sp.]NNJ62263.1 hypothetical protein [Dactylosporangium sp.]
MVERLPLPDQDLIARRVRAGIPASTTTTLGTYLRRWHASRKIEATTLDGCGRHIRLRPATGLLFARPDGQPWHPETVSTRFEHLVSDADPAARPHEGHPGNPRPLVQHHHRRHLYLDHPRTGDRTGQGRIEGIEQYYGATSVQSIGERQSQVQQALFDTPPLAYALLAETGDGETIGMAACSWQATGSWRRRDAQPGRRVGRAPYRAKMSDAVIRVGQGSACP